MAGLRLLPTDRLNVGIIAAVAACALVLQMLAGSIAAADVARRGAGGSTGSEAAHGVGHGHHGARDGAPDCCAIPCQMACGFGFALESRGDTVLTGAAHGDFATVPLVAIPGLHAPRHPALCREARAPPPLSL